MSLSLILIIYLATGCIAGALAGLFGVGGGIVIVPVLIVLFSTLGFAPSILPKLAVGTSMAVVALTSVLSARTHGRNGHVDPTIVRRLLPFVIVGVVIGSAIGTSVPRNVLLIAVMAFEILVAIQFLIDVTRTSPTPIVKERPIASTTGSAVLGNAVLLGGISSIVGIAGGSLFVPFLTFRGLKLRTAIGTAATLGIPVGFVAALIYYVVGANGHDPLPRYSAGYIYVPAFAGCLIGSLFTVKAGALLGKRLDVRKLKAAFAIVLLIAAGRTAVSFVS